jgi:hypothetical protein
MLLGLRSNEFEDLLHQLPIDEVHCHRRDSHAINGRGVANS